MTIDESVVEEKSSFKMLGLSFFFSKFGWGSYIYVITKTDSKIFGALICSVIFFLLRLLLL